MVCSPYTVCQRVMTAASKVPYISSVKFFAYDKESRVELSLDEMRVAFNETRTLPNLYGGKTVYERVSDLESHVKQLTDANKSMWAILEKLQEKPKPSAGEPSTEVGSKRARIVN